MYEEKDDAKANILLAVAEKRLNSSITAGDVIDKKCFFLASAYLSVVTYLLMRTEHMITQPHIFIIAVGFLLSVLILWAGGLKTRGFEGAGYAAESLWGDEYHHNSLQYMKCSLAFGFDEKADHNYKNNTLRCNAIDHSLYCASLSLVAAFIITLI